MNLCNIISKTLNLNTSIQIIKLCSDQSSEAPLIYLVYSNSIPRYIIKKPKLNSIGVCKEKLLAEKNIISDILSKNNSFKTLSFPQLKIYQDSESFLIYQPFHKGKLLSSIKLNNQDINCIFNLLTDIHSINSTNHPFDALGLLEKKESILKKHNIHIDKEIIHPLKKKIKELSQKNPLTTSFSHGDFNPFNIIKHNKSYTLIDWEDAESKKHTLWDAFHFFTVYQRKNGRFNSTFFSEDPLNIQKKIIALAQEWNIDLNWIMPLFYLYIIDYAEIQSQEKRKKIKESQEWINFFINLYKKNIKIIK
ncbi:hypothetical protein DID76_02335 [Candidatus Marinamargulisbacteria bacterium SCGC AG-414-C22]|nr:hypothetical protein DID76_02335 [Candidatus Marinamargulisbacteria bacterium SCGC AG-414-C22]